MGCGVKLLGIIEVLLCFLLMALSAFYFYYLSIAISVHDIAAEAVYVISAVVLILMGILGIYATIKKSESLISNFAVVMLVMFVLGLIQIILVIYSGSHCDSSSNPFTFICDLSNDNKFVLYWFPQVALLVVNALAFIFAMIQKRMWNKEGGGNYYS